MTVSYALLGLLNEADRHGYDLKQSYDRRFGAARPLRFGQVYRTLAQLERDGLITVIGVEQGAGPDRKRYSITADGVTDLERWLSEPEDPQPQLQTVLFTKVVLALLSGQPAEAFLEAQRQRHLAVVGREDAGEAVQQCGLSGAAGPHHGEHLALGDRDVDPAQRRRPPEALVQPPPDQQRLVAGHSSISAASVSRRPAAWSIQRRSASMWKSW